MANIEKNLNTLANMLGFGKGLKSYAKLYGTSINTFAKKDASMWFFTINLNVNNDVTGVSINTTYFNPTEQTTKIIASCSYNNPMPIVDVIALLK